jgi:tetratricopeptide (TPR) repeat protein
MTNPKLRGNPFLYFPIAGALQLGLMALYSTLSYSIISYGWGQILLVEILSAISVAAFLSCLESYVTFPKRGPRNWRATVVLVAVTALLSIDSAIILGSQGWPSPTWSLFKEHATYFSFPFQDYLERNVILVNSLIRHDASPFLFNSIVYLPLTWCHFSALVTFPFSNLPRFSLVEATTLATAFVFLLTVLWAMVMVRPKITTNRRLGALVVILAFAHADILNFVMSLFVGQIPAIEANGTYPPGYFRNNSIKLVSLLSPETSIALLMVLLSWVFMRYGRTRQRSVMYSLVTVFMVFAFLSSPLLALLFYPLFFLSELAVRLLKKRAVSPADLTDFLYPFAALSVAVMLAWPLSGRSIAEWLSPLRQGLQFPLATTMDVENWVQIPFLWVGTSGMLGVAMILIALGKIRNRRNTIFLNSLSVFLIAGGLIWHYAVTGTEIRYGYSLLAAVFGTIFVARHLPGPNRWAGKPFIGWGLQLGVMVTLGLHLYFLYSHTQSPSALSASVPWRDYLKLNSIVEEKYPHLPVLAATDRNQLFPLVMESTTSFASPVLARALSTLSTSQYPWLLRMRTGADIPSYGLEMGYRAIEWGPVEERQWGGRIKERFVDSSHLLADSGEVQLYPLTDNLKKAVAQKFKPDSAEYHYHLAEQLAERGWQQEALDNYFDVTRLDPTYAKAYNKIGLILANLGHPKEAAGQFSKAIQVAPRFQDAYNNLGALYVMNSDFDGAINTLKKALSISPSTETFVNLASAYSGMQRNDDAIRTYKLAMSLHPEGLALIQSYLGIGDVYIREGKFLPATSQYKKALKLAPKNVSIHLKLANAFTLAGKINDAIAQFNEALRIDPKSELALRGLAGLAPALHS